MLEYYRFKTVYDLFMKGRNEEARIELRELQQRYVEVCQEVSGLKLQKREYEDILFLARNLVADGGFYWLLTGSIRQGPFCPQCYDKDGLLIRVTELFPRRCSFCGTEFAFDHAPEEFASENSGGAARADMMESAQAVSNMQAIGGMEPRHEGGAAAEAINLAATGQAAGTGNRKARILSLSSRRK